MKNNNQDIAIVCGTGSYNDLGMIRSCGEAGFNVIYLTDQEHIVPIQKSRYLYHTEYIQPFNEISVIKYIDQIINSNKCKVFIFPTADITAYYIDRNYNHLNGRCEFQNAKGNLEKLMNKDFMTHLAQKCGLKVPKTIYANLDKKNDLSQLMFPCIIKPAKSIIGKKSDIVKCDNINDYNTAVKTYISHNCHEVIIQEFISGNNQKEIAVTGVAYDTEEAEFHGIIEKIRTRGNGSTVYGIYRPSYNNRYEIAINQFIRQSGYHGIFDMEFLVNDNGMYFIECNFRNGAYGYATTYAGFNMPSAIYCNTLHISRPKYKLKDTLFMEERSDFLNVLDKHIHFMNWIKDLTKTDVLLFWNWKDPKPLIRIPYSVKHLFCRK